MVYRRLVVCLLLVCAGCAGGVFENGGDSSAETVGSALRDSPTVTPTRTVVRSTPTPRPPVTVLPSADALPVNATQVYERTTTRLGVEPRGYVTVSVVPTEQLVGFTVDGDRFDALVGLNQSRERSRYEVTARTTGPATVKVAESVTDDATTTRALLAHEFTHVVQAKQNWFTLLRQALVPDESVNFDESGRQQVYSAVVEGSAKYVGAGAVERNQSVAVARALRRMANATPATRLAAARYVHGFRYATERVENASGLRRLHTNPPRTTEELLHTLPPGSEPVAPLTVGTEETGAWRAELPAPRKGELYLRTALSTELPYDRAVRAAAGWGNDRRVRFETDDQTAYVWAVRFDDRANATTFAGAAREWTSARRAATDETGFRVVRTGPETVVLLLGAPEFVRAASVSGSGGTVTVTVDEATGNQTVTTSDATEKTSDPTEQRRNPSQTVRP